MNSSHTVLEIEDLVFTDTKDKLIKPAAIPVSSPQYYKTAAGKSRDRNVNHQSRFNPNPSSRKQSIEGLKQMVRNF